MSSGAGQVGGLVDELVQVLALAGLPLEAGDRDVWPGHGHLEVVPDRAGALVRWHASARLWHLASGELMASMAGEGGLRVASQFHEAVMDAVEGALRSLLTGLGYDVVPADPGVGEDGPAPWSVLVRSGDGRGALVAALA